MARRALAELKPGDVVNLGVGIPTLVADLITPDHGLILHTENGMLGLARPRNRAARWNTRSTPANSRLPPCPAHRTLTAQFLCYDPGGHVDVAIMGGLQVDEAANLANWAIPGKPLLGVGGAMDLAGGAKKLIVTMTTPAATANPRSCRRLPCRSQPGAR